MAGGGGSSSSISISTSSTGRRAASGSSPQESDVRLSCMLTAWPRQCEHIYWTSLEVQQSTLLMDRSAVAMSLLGMTSFALVLIARGIATPHFHSALCCACAASTLHGFLLLRWPAAYLRRRHLLVGAQRLLRVLLTLLPLLTMRAGRHPASALLLAAGQHVHSGRPWLPLLVHCCFFPLVQFYSSMAYSLSARATLAAQLVSTGITAVMLQASSGALAATPGMADLAADTCSTGRAVMELVLYLVVDQAGMPGVPGAGASAFGTRGHCGGPLALPQLLLYANLCLCLLLPVVLAHGVELHHKLQFWRRRGARVRAAVSPLLPLPEHPWLSHVLVVLAWLVLLWFVAEALVPHLQPGGVLLGGMPHVTAAG